MKLCVRAALRIIEHHRVTREGLRFWMKSNDSPSNVKENILQAFRSLTMLINIPEQLNSFEYLARKFDSRKEKQKRKTSVECLH